VFGNSGLKIHTCSAKKKTQNVRCLAQNDLGTWSIGLCATRSEYLGFVPSSEIMRPTLKETADTGWGTRMLFAHLLV